jgi:hypothetical protein
MPCIIDSYVLNKFLLLKNHKFCICFERVNTQMICADAWLLIVHIETNI